jgi:hypothetical protein
MVCHELSARKTFILLVYESGIRFLSGSLGPVPYEFRGWLYTKFLHMSEVKGSEDWEYQEHTGSSEGRAWRGRSKGR